jgi:hypothetical protein
MVLSLPFKLVFPGWGHVKTPIRLMDEGTVSNYSAREVARKVS